VRTTGRVGLLVVLWLLAWGEASLANLLSGVVLAVALLMAFPEHRSRGTMRVDVLGLIRLGAHVVLQLVLSNLVMAREVLRPTLRVQPGVLVHRLEHPSDEVVTLLTSIIALSPGTMTVDVEADSSSISVHFFRLTDVDEARARIADLECLVIGAIASTPRQRS
jgi:multicomponent Na+:H+ antiporter subunit E